MSTRISVQYLPTVQPQSEGVRVVLMSSASVLLKQVAILQSGEAVELDLSAGTYLSVGEMPGAFPTNADAVATHSDLPAQAPITPPNVPHPPTPPFAIPDPPKPMPPSDAPAGAEPVEKPEGKEPYADHSYPADPPDAPVVPPSGTQSPT